MPVQFHKHALAVKVYQSKESFTWDEADAMWKAAFGRPFKGPATRAELRASRKVPAEWVKLHASLKAQRKFAHKVNNEGHNLFPSFFLFSFWQVVRLFQKFPLDQKLWDSMVDYYSKFFFLFSIDSKTMLVPTVFVDYVWHVHQVFLFNSLFPVSFFLTSIRPRTMNTFAIAKRLRRF